MLKVKLIYISLGILLGACNFVASGEQGRTSTSKGNSATQIQSQSSDKQSETSDTIISESTQKTSCPLRPLNPDLTGKPGETKLDRYFRIAYDAATVESFDVAIINYRRAVALTTCECERSHAKAGEQAAIEAKERLKTEGTASKPTQFFWIRLQELTNSLPCVTFS